MTNKIIFVVGGTASGKSGFAVELAKSINSQIISCDSMQIYKNMNIGTAKITLEEMQGISHHMIDIVECNQNFSVSEFCTMAKSTIEGLQSQDIIPIVVGGTGLYVDGLLYPMTFGVDKDLSIRTKLEKDADTFGNQYLHDKLRAIDPLEAEKIHCNNTKRLIRALEIYEQTGQIKSLMQDKTKQLNYDVLMFFLNPDRELLYQRINQRVIEMFKNGLINEVKFLLENNLCDWQSQSMQAIGYKEIKQYFDMTNSYDKTINLIQQNSRHYAKRQITWFKRYDFATIINKVDDQSITSAIEKVKDFASNK